MGAGRRVGAWMMLAGTVLVVVAVLVASAGADAVDAQMRQLDASQSRAEATLIKLATSVALAVAGILLFLVAGLAFLVGSSRAQKRGLFVAQPSRTVASVATLGLAIAILLAALAPSGPVQRLTAAATQSGDAVRIEIHTGNLTGVAASPNAPEDVWPYHPPTTRGAITLNFSSGSQLPYGTGFAVAILEAKQPDGSWKELARARGAHQVVEVPVGSYEGDLRVRTRMDEGAAGAVGFGFGFAFAPERS